MEHYNGDIINPEYVEHILSEIKKNNSPYIDIFETEDASDYLMPNNRIDEARILVEYSLHLHPKSIELLILLARIYMDSHGLYDAIEILTKLPVTAIEYPDYYILWGRIELIKSREQKAIENFEVACKIDEDLNFEVGLNLNHFGLHKDAIRFLKPYLDKYPDDDEAQFELAYAYEKNGMLTEAQTTYEKLVDQNPFYAAAWYNLGIIYNNDNQINQINQINKAIKAYETAITIDPNYAEAHFNLGNIYMNISQYEKALNSYTEYASLTIQNKPDYSVIQYIGECWWELGNADLARRFYKLAMKNTKGNRSLSYAYALSCMELNDNKEALKVLNRLIASKNDAPEFHFARAQAQYNLLNKQKAYDDLLKGLDMAPNTVMAWHEAMRMYISINGIENIGDFLKQNKKYKSYPAFQLITFIVQYCFLRKLSLKTVMKTLEQVAKDHKGVIYEAAEDDAVGKLFTDPNIVAVLKKYDITLHNMQS